MGKIANAMPVMPGSRAQVLLARVSQEEESLVCYRVPSASSLSRARSPATATRERPDCELEVMLRVPLCLALVASVGDTSVSVTMPSQDLWGKLRGLRKPACEPCSALKGQPPCEQPDAPQGWTLECKSPEAASRLLERLQMAGCVVQGLQRRYHLMDVIGKGNFGVVLRAEDLHTGAIVAIKVFTKVYDQKLMHPLLEASILRSCRHENIQEFLGVYELTEVDVLDRLEVESSRTYAIVSEFLAGGELLAYLQRPEKVTEDRARSLVKQLLSAISRLHDASIVHRDIKPENLMLTDMGSKVKLIDFGLSALDSDFEAMTMKAGSPGYAAPEVLTGPQTCKADCFSCGVILYILLTGKAPFPGRDANEVLVKNMLCQVSVSPLANVSGEAKDLVMGLLRKSPRMRLSAAEALGHDWFTQPAPPSAAPVAPATPRTGQATPRARHLPSLKMMQPLITRRPLGTHGAAALIRRPDATPALELDLGDRLPNEAGVRRRDTSPDRDGIPTLLPPAAAPRATGASAARALAFTSAAAAQAAETPDGDTGGPPQRDTSPAPAVERLTIHDVRRHDVSSASGCDFGDAVRQDGCASPVHAWSKQIVPDRPSFLERFSFGERSERPSFNGDASSPLYAKKVRRPPKLEERPSGLFPVPPQAGARASEKGVPRADAEQAGAPVVLAVVRLPSSPPPGRHRRPAGLHQHRHRILRQS